MIKKLLCLSIMLSSCTSAFAVSKEDKLESLNAKLNAGTTSLNERIVKADSRKAISLGKAQKQLLGIWNILDENGELESTINIKSVEQSDRSINFNYDELFDDGSVSTSGLIGRFEAKRMIFNVPLLSFDNTFVVKIKKNSGKGVQIVSRDGDCSAKDASDLSLGFDCSFIFEGNSFVSDVTMQKI